MCDFNFEGAGRRGHRCPKAAIAECTGCLGEFCGGHLISQHHGCVEIIDTLTKKRADQMGSGSVTGRNVKEGVNVNDTKPAVVITDAIKMRTMEFLDLCKTFGVCGIVVLLGGDAEMQILGHGIDAGNAAAVLGQISDAAALGTIETEIEIDLRSGTAN